MMRRAALAVLLLIAGCGIESSPDPVPPQPKTPQQAEDDEGSMVRAVGRRYAEAVLKRMLKRPRSSEWPRDSVGWERGPDLIKDGRRGRGWRVWGVVLAQNDFGATNEDRWELGVWVDPETKEMYGHYLKYNGELLDDLGLRPARGERMAVASPEPPPVPKAEPVDSPSPLLVPTKPGTADKEAERAFNLARNLDRSNKRKQAVEAYEAFLAAYPDAPEAEQARKRLKALKK